MSEFKRFVSIAALVIAPGLVSAGCRDHKYVQEKPGRVNVDVYTPGGDVHVQAPKPRGHERDTNVRVGQ